ncbi:hypothetical protein ADK38_43050, partial [Streptomyces varsoviensis]
IRDVYKRQWDSGGVDLLVWVTASGRDAVVSAYAHAAAQVVPQAADPGDADPEQAARTFLSWLETAPVRWLVVLDDLADPGLLRGLW